jgi:hypothetical protein
MNSSRRIVALLVTASLSLAACGSSDDSSDSVPTDSAATIDTAATTDTATTDTTTPAADSAPATTTDASSDDEKDESGDPAPPSRRTTIDDVSVFDPSSPDGDFPRAAVPVDAYAASEVLDEPTDGEVEATVSALETDGHVVIPVVVETCTLVAVWALPHPGELVVGYEEHPNVDCIRSVPRTAVFTLPIAGENSEGEWDFAEPYDVTLQRRVG